MAIAVIAILASTLYFSVLGYTARARDTTRATDLRKVAQGLDGYFTAHDVYPPTTCGIDGYDCINIDSGSFITSTESAWSTAPLAYSSSPFLSSSPLDAFLVLLSPVSYADTVPLPP